MLSFMFRRKEDKITAMILSKLRRLLSFINVKFIGIQKTHDNNHQEYGSGQTWVQLWVLLPSSKNDKSGIKIIRNVIMSVVMFEELHF